ncbi:hypothetical protein NC652_038454 [Populus alba x Populus x berolinensis]|nr:hypothetical protein NC652_038454 [Populus alba x Populus x berolinensis]
MQDKDQGTSCFIISTILSPLSSFEQYFSSNSVRVEEDEEKKKKSGKIWQETCMANIGEDYEILI